MLKLERRGTIKLRPVYDDRISNSSDEHVKKRKEKQKKKENG
jgi:hypothetical protein